MDSRAEFEQAVKDKWSDSFLFGRDTNGDYADEAVKYMWLGWLASRQAIEGEAVAIVDRVGIMQRISPYTNLPEGTKLYTHPARADVPEKWRTVMKELADDLESEIEARRSGDLNRRIERDLIVVKEARVLLDEQEQGQ